MTSYYAHAGAASSLIPLDSSTITLNGTETDLPVNIDIAGCLADPARELPAGLGTSDAASTCILHVSLALYDASGHLLDQVTLAPITVTPGAQATAPAVQIGSTVTSVAVTPKTVTLNAIGFTSPLNAVVIDQNGQPIVGPSLAWSSVSPSVATIDANSGVVTARGVGTAKVVATSRTRADTATITVRQIPKSITVTGVPATLVQFDSSLAAFTSADSGGTTIPAGAVTVQFSSSNANIVTVNAQTGRVKAVGTGTAQVFATSGTVTGATTVTVTAAAVASVVVTPATPSIALGATQQFTAAVLDAAGNAITGRLIVWSSSDTTVATGGGCGGLATSVRVGTATITGSVGTISGTATLTVAAPGVASVTVSPPTSTLYKTQTVALSANVKDTQGNAVSGATLAWTSSDNNVATVDATGLVTAQGPGSAIISAATGGVTGTAAVSVSAASLMFTTQPGNGSNGQLLLQQPVVQVVDANQQVIAGYNGPVSVTLNVLSGSGALSGGTTVIAVNGVAAFTNLSVAGTGQFNLTLSAPITPAVTSATFTVSNLVPTQLVLTTQPGGAASGVLLSPQPVVQVRDANNLLVTTSSAPITVALLGSGGTLQGTQTVSAVNGIATFTDLSVIGPGTYTLVFTSPGLTSVTSASAVVLQAALRVNAGALRLASTPAPDGLPRGDVGNDFVAERGADDSCGVIVSSGILPYAPACSRLPSPQSRGLQ